MSDYRIRDLNHYLSLCEGIYSSSEGPRWDQILPYYKESIHFEDTVQEIRGIKDFTEMIRRLSRRSKKIEYVVHNSSMQGNLIFIEWEMVISYKTYPETSIYGVSRTTLKDGKIIEQRDYYDLWGDILKNIKLISGGYRRFMRKRFG